MKWLLTVLTLIVGSFTFAQNTDISGTINTYASVSNIAGNIVTVNSSASFNTGDLVLIVQMQGATIDETDSPAFGDIVNINDAGNYEIVQVCGVPSGTELSVSNLQRTYNTAGIVQVVLVPEYQQATITSDVTAQNWDGSTGGIVALKCSSLIMNAGIDVQGAGFNGGAITTSTFTCQWFFQPSDYFYPISTGEGAMKGEGVANYITNKTGGRGAQANGGGGGNDHNTGGGGGANASNGGQGGNRIAESTFFCSGTSPGIGGKAYSYSNSDNKIYLGGGGGAGHENNAGFGTAGGNGGGIALIIADTIVGNSNSINAQGIDGLMAEDGAGGGGAGGTVLLDASVYTGTLNVNCSGADGGDTDNVGPSNCNGPGGGGSGGLLWVSNPTVPAEITFDYAAGVNGVIFNASQANCIVGASNNAAPGQAGFDLISLQIPMPVQATGTDVLTECDSLVWIDGMTYYSTNNTAMHTIPGGAASGCDSIVMLDLTINAIDESVTQNNEVLTANEVGATYQWIDCNGMSPIVGETSQVYNATANGDYAVIVTNNGCTDTSSCYTVSGFNSTPASSFEDLIVYPNPTDGRVIVELGKHFDHLEATITDMHGRIIGNWQIVNSQQIEINFEAEQGVYILKIESDNKQALIRLLKD